MIYNIKEKLSRFKRNLLNLDNQSIGKASLIVVIFLDIFILISIFDGLDEHTRQLNKPYEYIPQSCRDIVIDGKWNETNQLTRLAKIISTSQNSYYYDKNKEKPNEQHSLCAPISKLVLSLKSDRSISSNIKELLASRNEIKDLNSEITRIKGAYNTSLLERIADKESEKNNVTSLQKEIANKTRSLNKVLNKQQLLESSLLQDKRIEEIFSIVANISDKDRTILVAELRNLNFWYPVKRLGMELLFLLPLFFIFYFWNSRSISKNRPFQTFVSAHLLVVSFIPVFFKVFDLIYDIIPKKLLKHIVELLESLNLVAIWHYLSMAVSILIALALIYVLQKKLFSKEKLIVKRISKGLCQNCNKHLPSGISSCPFCGFQQYKKCKHCEQPTYVYGEFCKECGNKNEG